MFHQIASFLLALALLIPPVAAFAQDGSTTTYVVSSAQSVNARSCARLTCAVVARLAPGQVVEVTGTSAGDYTLGSATWYVVVLEGGEAHVHTSLLTSLTPELPALPSGSEDAWTAYTRLGATVHVPARWVDPSGDPAALQARLDELAAVYPNLHESAAELAERASRFDTDLFLHDPVTTADLMLIVDYQGIDENMAPGLSQFVRNLEDNGLEVTQSAAITLPAGSGVHVHGTLGRTSVDMYQFCAHEVNYLLQVIYPSSAAAEVSSMAVAIAQRLRITDRAAARSSEMSERGALRPGDNAGEVSRGRFQLWTYEAGAGDTVSIAVRDTLGTGDLYLVVRGPDGTVIASDVPDNATGPVIDGLELDGAGRYEVEVHARPLALPQDRSYVLHFTGPGAPAQNDAPEAVATEQADAREADAAGSAEAPPGGTGDWIAFAADPTGDYDIFKIRVDVREPLQLTDDPGEDVFPAWSPDGRRIAFASDRAGNFDIYVMEADGTNVVQLTNDPRDDVEPSWSADGKQIAFHSYRDEPASLYRMNVDGTDETRLVDSPSAEVNPAWSPDGRTIAFTRISADGTDICRIDADGTGQVALAHDPVAVIASDWSPDGSRLVFTRRLGEMHQHIYAMNGDGSAVVPLTEDPAGDEPLFDREPSWSPDGSQIVFSSLRNYAFDLYLMEADGSNVRHFWGAATDPEAGMLDMVSEIMPDWQPVAPAYS